MPHPAQSQTPAIFLTLLSLLLAQPLPGRPATAQEGGQPFRDCLTCPEMVVVPAGIFITGSLESKDQRQRFLTDEAGEVVDWAVEALKTAGRRRDRPRLRARGHSCPARGWLADYQPKLIHKALDLRALAGQPLPERNVVSWIAGMEADSSAGNVSRVVREVLDTYPGPEHKRLREALREWVLGAAQSWGIGEEAMKQVESLKEAGMVYAGVEELKERAHREGRATLVCRLARLKFGADTAERLSEMLEGVSDPERIDCIGDRIIQCETGKELLARAREV